MFRFGFPSAEQRARTAYFDKLVGSADLALQHPEAVARLGGFAIELRQINSRAFLPNVRGGVASIPKKYKDDLSAPALLPIFPHEKDQAQRMISPILDQFGPWTALDETMFSRGHGAMVNTKDFLRSIVPAQQDSELRPSMGYSEDDMGLLLGLTKHSKSVNIDPPYYASSRPIELINTSVAEEQDPYATAATVAHEHAHVRDVLAMGPTFGDLGVPSSEFAGHLASSVLYGISGVQSPAQALSDRVESLRQETVDPALPLTPTPHAVEEMYRLGVI